SCATNLVEVRRNHMCGRSIRVVTLIIAIFALIGDLKAQRKTEHLVLVTLDGARWQEVFGGLDLEVLQSTLKRDPATNASVEPVASHPAYQKYWAPTSAERRLKLLPFFWGTLSKQGTIVGNQAIGSRVLVSNGHRFSYPGYAEILTGTAHDEVINS